MNGKFGDNRIKANSAKQKKISTEMEWVNE
jgi:hypothetical protein